MSTIRVVNIQHTDATEPNIVLESDGTATFVSGITISGGTNLTVSGTASFASGTVAAPGVTFVEDNNTGIYSPAADEFGIATGGTERMLIDSSGNVGVGTAPASNRKVHIKGTGFTELLVENSDATTSAVMLAVENGVGSIYTRSTESNATAVPLTFHTGNDERMRIDSSGRLLVGTSSALTNGGFAQYAKLTSYGFTAGASGPGIIALARSVAPASISSGQAIGAVAFSASAGEEYATITCSSDGTSGTNDYPGRLVFNTNGGAPDTSPTERMRIDSSGNVGIGTTSVTTNFKSEIRGETYQLRISNAANNKSIRFGTNDPEISATGASFGIRTTDANPLLLFTNNQERMLIDSSGNVGIGESSPSAKLDVYLGDNVAGTIARFGGYNDGRSLVISNSGIGNLVDINHQGGSGEISISTGSSERMRIDSSGRLLVGTSSSSQVCTLHLQGHSNNSSFQGILALSVGSTSPSNGESIGDISFSDSNHDVAALIRCARDGGTWTSNSSQPTRLTFSTTADGASSPTERMRIHSAGTISTARGLTIGDINGNTASPTRFYIDGSALATGVGTHTLKWNSSTGQVTQDSSSRLVKEQISDCAYGLEEIKLLQPRKYFRSDSQVEEIGFIADEVAAVMPEFVPIGSKSVITGNSEDTEEVPLSVNYDKMTAVLTAALQEAIAKIETLEAKVAALEAG